MPALPVPESGNAKADSLFHSRRRRSCSSSSSARKAGSRWPTSGRARALRTPRRRCSGRDPGEAARSEAALMARSILARRPPRADEPTPDGPQLPLLQDRRAEDPRHDRVRERAPARVRGHRPARPRTWSLIRASTSRPRSRSTRAATRSWGARPGRRAARARARLRGGRLPAGLQHQRGGGSERLPPTPSSVGWPNVPLAARIGVT